MLTVCTWLWGDKYGGDYIHRLASGVRRHLTQPYRFVVLKPESEDAHLIKIPGCFARLRMFDPEWQRGHGITDRLVCLDLDLIVTGPLDPLFDRPEPFVILGGANAANPCPFNGSVMMLRPGAHPEVWLQFTLEKARNVPYYAFPDDQGWLWHMLPNSATWGCGRKSGIYAFRKPGWPGGDDAPLPSGARMVCFPGKRDPSQFAHLGWVKEHWLCGS